MINIFKDSIRYVVTPILLIVLVILLTQSLWIERQKMIIPSSNVTNNGSVSTYLKIDAWEPYYGGGQGIDRIITRTGASLRISTGGDGGWYGARANIDPNIDLGTHAISFSVYADDWQALDRLMVLFGTNDGFTDYYGINLRNYFSNPADKEWLEVVLERSAFESIEGLPEWSEVTDIAIRVVPTPAVSTRVWFDNLKIIPDTASAPIVSFTFDDGFRSVVDAANIMSYYGYAGTAYVIPKFLGTEGYMTKEDLDTLASLQWDISGHSDLNLTELIPSDTDTELAQMLDFLETNNYTGSEHFAYPNGAYNQSVKSQVLEYFTSARTIDGFSQPSEYFYPANVNAITISSSTPVTSIIETINEAKVDNSWLILVWHDFNEMPIDDVEYNINDFETIVHYLSEQGIAVEPYSIVYRRLNLNE